MREWGVVLTDCVGVCVAHSPADVADVMCVLVRVTCGVTSTCSNAQLVTLLF